MAVDWAGAWEELERFAASKPYHGSKDLALKLLELKAQHHVEDHHLAHTFIAYGVRLQEDLLAAARGETQTTRDNPSNGSGDSLSGTARGEPAHRIPGGNDGSIRPQHPHAA